MTGESQAASVVSAQAPSKETHSVHDGHAPATGMATFASLRYRDYRYLWVGTLFMSAGLWVQQLTLGWLLYDLTGSPMLLGVLNGLRAAPALIAGPLGGVMADRTDRRMLLFHTQTFLCASALVMGLLVWTEWVEVWHVLVFAGATGIAWAIGNPLRQTIIPSLVPRQEVMNATALTQTAFNLNKIMGPLAGGVIILVAGAAGNFLLQGVVFAGVMVTVLLMRVPAGLSVRGRTSAWVDFKEGIRYVRATPVVLALMVASLIPNVLGFPYQTLLPVFQKDVLQLGPEALGVMFAAPGVGGIVSLFWLATFYRRIHRRGLLALVSLGVMGTTLVLFSQSSSLPLAALCLVFTGAAQVVFNNTAHTLLLMVTPDELRGRITALYTLDHGLAPLGAMLAGVAAHFFGAPAAVAAMGCSVVLLAVAVAWRAPQLRDWRSD